MKSRSEQEASQINAKQSHIDYHKNENEQIARNESYRFFFGGGVAKDTKNVEMKQNGNTKIKNVFLFLKTISSGRVRG